MGELITRGALALACAIGLAGAFVGLDVSSLWVDELFTAWVVGENGDVGALTGRILTDLHPPLYYYVIFGFARLLGDSDVSLRLLSALCAAGAIGLFIFGLRKHLSLNARLFGAAIAVASNFWFFQSQNARSYGLCMLIGVGVLVIALNFLARRGESGAALRAPLLGLFALMTLGAFTHYYMLYVALAVLAVLWLYTPSLRVLIAVLGAALAAGVFAYIKILVEPNAKFLAEGTWIGDTLSWYVYQLVEARRLTLNKYAMAALLICIAAVVVRQFAGRRLARLAERPDEPGATLSPDSVLLAATPMLVLAAGVASSIVLSPNFSDRNFLACSPFLWALGAKLYEEGIGWLRAPLRAVAGLGVAALMLVAGSIVLGRPLPRNSPFDQAAAWIQTFDGCRGQTLATFTQADSSLQAPGYAEMLAPRIYGRYLGGFMMPAHLFRDTLTARALPEPMRADLEARLSGGACPILGWTAHNVPDDHAEAAVAEFVAAFAAPGAAKRARARTFRPYNVGLNRSPAATGVIVVYADPDA